MELTIHPYKLYGTAVLATRRFFGLIEKERLARVKINNPIEAHLGERHTGLRCFLY